MAPVDFDQIEWDAATEEACRSLVRMALREDLATFEDWTSVALVPQSAVGTVHLVARNSGILAGLRAVDLTIAEVGGRVEVQSSVRDGTPVAANTVAVILTGSARTILTAERTVLNIVGHLSGVATLASRYVEAVAGTRAKIYDTRKTLPAWRRLEKFAARAGGARNHRSGLFDAILIKDNHLAIARRLRSRGGDSVACSPSQAVAEARAFAEQLGDRAPGRLQIEVEIDTLEDFESVLAAGPDIVLLDNMSMADLVAAVARRDALAPGVELEASGGVALDTVHAIAQTGVDRISVGAITHSAPALDVAFDWKD